MMNRVSKRFALLSAAAMTSVALGLSACSGAKTSDSAPAAAGAAAGAAATGGDAAAVKAAFATIKVSDGAATKEFMQHVMDPAAWKLWHMQGTVYDAKGEHELYPTTPEGWEDAVTASLTIAEISNLLLLPPRNNLEPEWAEFSRRLHETAMQAKAAAENKDKDAFFQAGADVYSVCTACHQKYIDMTAPVTSKPLPGK